MEEKPKKPFYTKWWFWAIVVVVVVVAVSGGDDEPELEEAVVENGEVNEIEETDETENNSTDENNDASEEDNDISDENESSETSSYTDDEIESIINEFEERIDADREDFGDEFYLDQYEYDADTNTIEAWVDMQFDPIIEDPDEVEEWSETHAWSLGEAVVSVDDPTHDVQITLVTKIDDGEYIHWGTTQYEREANSYSFSPGDGMQLIE